MWGYGTCATKYSSVENINDVDSVGSVTNSSNQNLLQRDDDYTLIKVESMIKCVISITVNAF